MKTSGRRLAGITFVAACLALAAPRLSTARASPLVIMPADTNLSYDVTGVDPKYPGQSFPGHGTLKFHAEGNQYRAHLEAQVTLLFVTLPVLSSDSSGLIGSDGLEPLQFSETPRKKPTSTLTFSRSADGIGLLSNAPGSQPTSAPAGTQDRLSVLLQIGALLQGNASFKKAGAHFTIPVASLAAAAESWDFAVAGLEVVSLKTGARKGWHVSRVLHSGTNERGIDVWVASDATHAPLHVRYTEPNGSTIDLMLNGSS